MTNETRDERQAKIALWVAATFGAAHMRVEQRAIRLLEEAVELYQAAGCPVDLAHKLVDYVFSREPGSLRQEIGGLGLTLCAVAQAAGVSANLEERREFDRVLSKSREHFRERDEVKNAAGFKAPNPFEPEETPEQRSRRVGAMIRANADARAHDAAVRAQTRNSETLAEFAQYCQAHPHERFWQALKNWSGQGFIYAGYGSRMGDTYEWTGRNGRAVDATQGGQFATRPK